MPDGSLSQPGREPATTAAHRPRPDAWVFALGTAAERRSMKHPAAAVAVVAAAPSRLTGTPAARRTGCGGARAPRAGARRAPHSGPAIPTAPPAPPTTPELLTPSPD